MGPIGSPMVPINNQNGNPLITLVENLKDLQPCILKDLSIKRPCYMSHSNGVIINEVKHQSGVYWHGIKDESDIDEWICSPLTVEAITSSTSGDDYGSLLKFRNIDDGWCNWAMPRRLLKSRGGDELLGVLLDKGFKYHPQKRNIVVDYIMSTIPSKRITAATTVGWYTNESFVLPNRTIGKSNVVFQAEVAVESEFTEAGTMEAWQQTIGNLCVGNIPLIVSVCAALAGPLLSILNRQQGGAIHWVNDSSSGKSTSAAVAASVWGSPDFMRSWSATANGLEGIAATRNDTCLILDEISEAHPEEIGKIIYVLMNGQGKQRASQKGNARKIHRWKTFGLSTGEQTLAGKMSEIGKKPQVGQEVRLLSIPAKFEHGVFSNLHNFQSGRHFADGLKESCAQNYGHIGPAFVSHLIKEKRDLSNFLREIVQTISKDAKSNPEQRASSTFGIIALAGELGIEYGLLPWEEESVLKAILVVFKRWQESQGANKTEDERILQSVSNFILKHGDSRFSETNEERPINNRAGWYKDTTHGRVYMFSPYALDEAGGGYDRKRIVDALDRAGWIIDRNKDRYTTRTSIKNSKIGLYHICEITEDL